MRVDGVTDLQRERGGKERRVGNGERGREKKWRSERERGRVGIKDWKEKRLERVLSVSLTW